MVVWHRDCLGRSLRQLIDAICGRFTFGVYAGALRRNDLVALDTFPAALGSLIFLVALTIAAVWFTGDRLRRIELP